MPPVGALDQLRAANGQDGLVERVRSNPRWTIAVAIAAVLLIAWIAWAIYVTSSKGATAGLGVVLAWPAILAALALISLPFIGVYLLIRGLSDKDGSRAEADAEAPAEGEKDDSEEVGTGDEESEEEEGDEEDGDEEDGGGEERVDAEAENARTEVW